MINKENRNNIFQISWKWRIDNANQLQQEEQILSNLYRILGIIFGFTFCDQTDEIGA